MVEVVEIGVIVPGVIIQGERLILLLLLLSSQSVSLFSLSLSYLSLLSYSYRSYSKAQYGENNLPYTDEFIFCVALFPILYQKACLISKTNEMFLCENIYKPQNNRIGNVSSASSI